MFLLTLLSLLFLSMYSWLFRFSAFFKSKIVVKKFVYGTSSLTWAFCVKNCWAWLVTTVYCSWVLSSLRDAMGIQSEVPGSNCGISANHLNLLYVLESLKTNSFENSFEVKSDFTIMEPGLILIFFYSAFNQPYWRIKWQQRLITLLVSCPQRHHFLFRKVI